MALNILNKNGGLKDAFLEAGHSINRCFITLEASGAPLDAPGLSVGHSPAYFKPKSDRTARAEETRKPGRNRKPAEPKI